MTQESSSELFLSVTGIQRCVPRRTLLPHTAPQGLATSALGITAEFVRFVAFIAASAILRDHRLPSTSGGTKQLVDRNHVNPLASFPMYVAFPRSKYYDVSDALVWHRWTAHLHIHIRASHVHTDVLCGYT